MTSTTDLRLMLNRTEVLAGELNRQLGPLRQALADARAGGMRAQSYDGEGGRTQPWCWTHERTIAECRRAERDCDGEVIEAHDPTGEAAVARATLADRATRDARRFEDGITRALDGLQQAAAVAGNWEPPAPVVDESCPEGSCRSCWRHEKTLTPVAEGRYRDLCRWCGGFRGEHGIDPPLAVLVARHTPGMVVTTKLVGEALAKTGRKLKAS